MATQNKVTDFNLSINQFNLKNVLKYSAGGFFVILFLFTFYYLIPVILIALLKD